jgi:hypothetical protein
VPPAPYLWGHLNGHWAVRKAYACTAAHVQAPTTVVGDLSAHKVVGLVKRFVEDSVQRRPVNRTQWAALRRDRSSCGGGHSSTSQVHPQLGAKML